MVVWGLNRMDTRVCLHDSLFRDPNQARLCTEFPGQTGHRFCSASRESDGLYSLFKCLCKQGFWMCYAVSHVLLIRGVENCI